MSTMNSPGFSKSEMNLPRSCQRRRRHRRKTQDNAADLLISDYQISRPAYSQPAHNGGGGRFLQFRTYSLISLGTADPNGSDATVGRRFEISPRSRKLLDKFGRNKLCGRPLQYAPPTVTLTFNLLTLKVVSESHVTWATSVPILVFLGLCSRLRPTTCTRQTSDREKSDIA